MSTTVQQYELTFTFLRSDAHAVLNVMAYDEAHAVRRAEDLLNKDLLPQLNHIKLVA